MTDNLDGRRVGGVLLFGLADVAGALALLTAFGWAGHRWGPSVQASGVQWVIGPVVLLVAGAVWQPMLRRALGLAGVGVAVAVCAVAWPMPDWTWLVAFPVGVLLRV